MRSRVSRRGCRSENDVEITIVATVVVAGGTAPLLCVRSASNDEDGGPLSGVFILVNGVAF